MTDDSEQLPAEQPRDLPGQDPGSPRRPAASEIRSTPVPVSATTGLLTEGPRWHAERGELLWVDILGHALHRGRPGPGGALESVVTITVDRPVGAGMLYRLELDGTCTRVLAGLTISNGIGWSPDGATMYLADSGTGQVEAFDFDSATGDLTQRRTLARIQQPGVVPTGSLSMRKGGSGWRCGAVVRSSAMAPTGRCYPRSASPSINRHHARSGGPSLLRCSSPPPELGSTRPPLTASPTPATCSGSTASA
jgi:sugar lactone lactonase YvrE